MRSDRTAKPANFDRDIEAAVEAEMRELVQRDGASLRRTSETDSELLAKSIGTMVQRVAGTSVQEIDDLIAELETLRALLQEEAARVQRNLAEYAHLSQSAMQSTNIRSSLRASLNGSMSGTGPRTRRTDQLHMIAAFIGHSAFGPCVGASVLRSPTRNGVNGSRDASRHGESSCALHLRWSLFSFPR
jgi:hypothetical protein